jgi:hypothetical protein
VFRFSGDMRNITFSTSLMDLFRDSLDLVELIMEMEDSWSSAFQTKTLKKCGRLQTWYAISSGTEKSEPAQMDPIATYEGSTLEFRGRAELFSDSIRLTGTVFLRYDYDTTYPLRTLQPRIDRFKMRSGTFSIGLALLLFAVVGTSILVFTFKINPLNFEVGLVGIFIPVGLLFAMAGWRKKEYAYFLTEAGIRAFAIVRSGKDRERFEEFTELIVEQIRKERKLA